MFVKFNNNPSGANIDDCYIRATSLATEIPYYDMMDLLFDNADKVGYKECHLANMLDVMKKRGWTLYQLQQKLTVNQLAKRLGEGRYVIITAGHATCAIDGSIYDTWNCNRYKALYYFKKEK